MRVVLIKKALKPIYDYLMVDLRELKWVIRTVVHYRVPQGSIHGPLLFNITICDITSGNANYDDETTPYKCG